MIKVNESLGEVFNSYFFTPLTHNLKSIQLDTWLQSYDNANNKIKQRNLNPVFANISNTKLPTSDSAAIAYYVAVIPLRCKNNYSDSYI